VRTWVRLPTDWVRKGLLAEFQWGNGGIGANHIAALMALIAIAHVAESETGVCRVTYNRLCGATGLSRAKLARGLEILERFKLIDRELCRRSHMRLGAYNPYRGWGKLPAKGMYRSFAIDAFSDFKLRRRVELDAVKIFLVFVAFRGNDINAANIGYSNIEKYSGVSENKIKSAISLLVTHNLIVVDQIPRKNEPGVWHTYRIVGIDPYRHMGTSGRGDVGEFRGAVSGSTEPVAGSMPFVDLDK
jgi:hypothetical protein